MNEASIVSKLWLFGCLVFIFTGRVGASKNQTKQLNKEDWAEPHYRVFAVHGPRLYPEETRDLLLELDTIYEPYSDDETLKRKSKVGTLLLLSEIGYEQCTREQFVLFEELSNYYDVYSRNVLPYLRHYKSKLLEFCLDNLADILVHNAENIMIDDNSSEQIEKFGTFLIEMKEENLDEYHAISFRNAVITDEQLVRGTIKFIELKLAKTHPADDDCPFIKHFTIKGHATLIESVDRILEKEISNSCSKWIRTVDIVHALLQQGLHIVLNREQEMWYENFLLCKKLSRLQGEIRRTIKHHVKRGNGIISRIKRSKIYKNLISNLNLSARR